MRGKRAGILGGTIVLLLFGAVAAFLGSGARGTQAVMAQAPTFGPTNTVAAETARAGVTALAATDAPPTATPRATATPIPTFTPAPRAIATGAPPGVGVSAPPTAFPSSGSATSRGTPAGATTSGGGSGGSALPVVGILAAIAAIGAAGFFLARNARGTSSRR